MKLLAFRGSGQASRSAGGYYLKKYAFRGEFNSVQGGKGKFHALHGAQAARDKRIGGGTVGGGGWDCLQAIRGIPPRGETWTLGESREGCCVNCELYRTGREHLQRVEGARHRHKQQRGKLPEAEGRAQAPSTKSTKKASKQPKNQVGRPSYGMKTSVKFTSGRHVSRWIVQTPSMMVELYEVQ